MTRRKERPFTIGDAMILVVAASLGMALLRQTNVDALPRPSASLPFLRLAETVTDRLMIFMTLGWAVLRLRRPHPQRRIMLRRLGSAAGGAAAIGVLVCLLFGVTNLMFIVHPPNLSKNWHLIRILFFVRIIGPIVLGAMSALLLSRRWRMRGGWIESMGLGIGSYWAFWCVYGFIRPVFHHFFSVIG